MFPLRGLVLAGNLRQVLRSQTRNTPIVQNIRKEHSYNYRSAPPPAPRANIIGAEIVSAVMWWWILHHIFTEYEHITGEFPYPDTSSWTNAELGIPPDDAQ